jgi:hypothetical protein
LFSLIIFGEKYVRIGAWIVAYLKRHDLAILLVVHLSPLFSLSFLSTRGSWKHLERKEIPPYPLYTLSTTRESRKIIESWK